MDQNSLKKFHNQNPNYLFNVYELNIKVSVDENGNPKLIIMMN